MTQDKVVTTFGYLLAMWCAFDMGRDWDVTQAILARRIAAYRRRRMIRRRARRAYRKGIK